MSDNKLCEALLSRRQVEIILDELDAVMTAYGSFEGDDMTPYGQEINGIISELKSIIGEN